MDANITGAGINSGIEAQVESTFQSLRASYRPIDYVSMGSIYGHYRANLITGTTVSISAAGAMTSFRWTATNSYAVIMRIEATAQVSSAITIGTQVDLEAIIARGFTASDTGGTAVTPGLGLKNRASMGNSLVGDLRVATTAALGAGTRTLDSVGIAIVSWGLYVAPSRSLNNNTVVGVGAGDNDTKVLYQNGCNGQHPIVLGVNEGIITRVSTAGPVTGGIRYAVTMEWAEVGAY